jgi:hypothetical protein
MNEDRALSAIALVVAAALGWNVIADRARVDAIDMPAMPGTIEAFETRVMAVAEAIAVAEGYYARGDHDGRTLPYRLNNPGSLKKPALNAEALPTWRDTGLVSFPTREMGWRALRHQVRVMLRGRSRVYDPTDTLATAGRKYADGDPNWARTVAARLGVPADATLVGLVAPAPAVRP